MPNRLTPSGDLKCDITGCTTARTFSDRGLAIHKKFAHGVAGTRGNPRSAISAPGPHQCNLCGHTAASPQALGIHKRVMHGVHGASRPAPDTPFECSSCHRHFKNQHGLSLHFSLKHKGTPASNGKSPAASAPGLGIPSLDEAITALEIKRDALQWVIEDLKRIALSQ